MISSSARRIGVVLVAVALVALSMSAPALAQAANNSSDEPVLSGTTGGADEQPEQPTSSSTTATESRSSEPQTVVAQVDSDLRVTNYSYSEEDQIFSVVLSNSGPSTDAVTITEAADPTKDIPALGIEQVRVAPGETVTVPVELLSGTQGAAVTVVTQDGIDQGRVPVISAETGYQFVSGSATWRDVQVGGAVGIGASILMTLLVSWHVVARKSADYERVEIA